MLAPRQGDTDFVKILDFGLAKLAPETLEDEGEAGGSGPGQVITRHGSVFGTPRYMAPEQCVGGEVDSRADLYALGLILYEALTGLHPFDEREPRRMIKHQLFTPIPPMRTRAPGVSVPASLEALVLRLVEKSRGKRFASATELLTALAEVCEHEGILPPEPSNRFPTPRMPTPGGGAAARLANPRGLKSDAMATQDAVDAEATQDVPPENSTQGLSSVVPTMDLPSLSNPANLSVAVGAPDRALAINTQEVLPDPRREHLTTAKTQDLSNQNHTQDLSLAALTQPPAALAVSGRETAPLPVRSLPTELPHRIVLEPTSPKTSELAIPKRVLIALAVVLLGLIIALLMQRC